MSAGKIYKIINIDNQKVYIGKTIKELDKRFSEHVITAKRWLKEDQLAKAHPYQSRLYPAMNLHGYDKFKIELVELVDDIASLGEREIYWISFYNSTDDAIGYNISRGGLGGPLFQGHHHSDEAREKISKNSSEKIHLDPESILERKLPCTNKWQNLQNGEVIYSTVLPKGYIYPQQVISYKVYKSGNDFYICLGQRRQELLVLSLEQCQELINIILKIIIDKKNNNKNKASRQLFGKQKQQKYWDTFILQNNLNIKEYIEDYKKYQNCCPNKHLELIYNLPYNQIRNLNKFLGLTGGKSGHPGGKVIIEESNT